MALLNIPKLTQAAEDSVAYPILTKDVSSSTPSSNGFGGGAPGTGQSLDATVQNTIRQALGWRYRRDDAKGFTAALKKAFVLKDVEGHTEWDYQPQSYTVQADMGEITGAQASIYARAKNAQDQTLPLLAGLTPLLPDPDMEDIEAMRSIVHDEIIQLVGEFGQIAGPRVQRVESIFNLLIGPKPDYRNPEMVKGHLGQLGVRLGMKRRWVNTIEDEQDLTNFLILVDYTNSLYQTWVAQRDFFSRGEHGQPFLGTQLVMISQALASVVEYVQDAYDAMDSVYLGAAERQTTMLYFYKEFAPITLAELLDWGMQFSTNEGRQLLQEAGKDGVVAFRATINRLDYLLYLTSEMSKSDGHTGGRPFHTYRVQVALADVFKGFHLVYSEANKIRRDAHEDSSSLTAEGAVFAIDSLLEIDSTILFAGSPINATITVGGRNFKPGARMRLISKKDPKHGYEDEEKSSFAEPVIKGEGKGNFNQMTATFNLPASLASLPSTDAYTLVVVNPDGEEYAWLKEPVTVAELAIDKNEGNPPSISKVELKKSRSGSYRLIIYGSNFEAPTPSGGSFTCTLTPTGGSPTGPFPGKVKSPHEAEFAGTGVTHPWTGQVFVTNSDGLPSEEFEVSL